MPWKPASARWIAASSMPSSVATAIAASAFSTLCRPGRLSVTRSGEVAPGRSTSNVVWAPCGVTSTARTSAPASNP